MVVRLNTAVTVNESLPAYWNGTLWERAPGASNMSGTGRASAANVSATVAPPLDTALRELC